MEGIRRFGSRLLFFGLMLGWLSIPGLQGQPVRWLTDTLLIPGGIHLSPTPGGQILVVDKKGNLSLLDSMGRKLYHFSPRRPARVHLLEAWNPLRPFAFFRDFQEYLMLDRFLLSDGPIPLDPEKTGYARLVAPAQDGNLWVLDERNFVLKKMDPLSQNTLFTQSLDLVLSGRQYDLTFMREYENQLFVADARGMVLQFDMMGTFRKKIPLQGCSWLSFRGEELVGKEGDSLSFYHIRKGSKRKWPLPLPARKAQEWVLFSRHLLFVDENGLRRMPLD